MTVIAINKKKSLDMFKSLKKNWEHQWFPKLYIWEISFKAEMFKRRTDWLTDWLTDSQSSLSRFYNIDVLDTKGESVGGGLSRTCYP